MSMYKFTILLCQMRHCNILSHSLNKVLKFWPKVDKEIFCICKVVYFKMRMVVLQDLNFGKTFYLKVFGQN